MKVAHKLNSLDVLRTLDDLFIRRGVPVHIRSDNGAEFTAEAVRKWLNTLDIKPLFIESGRPWENGYVESFNGTLRDGCLNQNWFANLASARLVIEAWRLDYNKNRPHSSLDALAPEQYVERMAGG